jgi:hypothetical protein
MTGAATDSWKAEILDSTPPPPLLYHYTTSSGLQGILESKSLWATDMAYLNDSTELKFGSTMIREIFQQLLKDSTDDFKYRPRKALYSGWRLSTVSDVLSYSINRFTDRFVFGVACFTEKPDLLSQWRGYGMPGGYAVAFDTEALKSILTIEAIPLAKVSYKPEPAQTIITKRLERWLDMLDQLETSKDCDPDAALAELHSMILGFAAQIKHESFSEETEWRIADLELTTSTRTHFRQGSLGLTPYVKIDLIKDLSRSPALLPIKSIMVGPGADASLRTHAVKALLERLGYPRDLVTVTASETPFRQV